MLRNLLPATPAVSVALCHAAIEQQQTQLETFERYFWAHTHRRGALIARCSAVGSEGSPGSAAPPLVPAQGLRSSSCHFTLYLHLLDQIGPLFLKEKKGKKSSKKGFYCEKETLQMPAPPFPASLLPPPGGGSGLLPSWKTGGRTWPGVLSAGTAASLKGTGRQRLAWRRGDRGCGSATQIFYIEIMQSISWFSTELLLGSSVSPTVTACSEAHEEQRADRHCQPW